MADCLILFEQSSNRITITLWDENKLPVTDAVVTMVMVDLNQEPVAGVGWPQTMANKGSGVYEVTLPGELEVVRDENYLAQVSSASPTRGDLYQEAHCRVEVLRG